MIRNYLIIAFRHIIRGFGFSMLNILGLSVGIACCLLITLYVQFELSYDTFHQNSDQLYRYIPRSEREGELAAQVYTPAGLAPFIKENFHEIDYVARYSGIDANPLFKWNDEVLRPGLFSIADSSFFKMFSFSLLHGEPENVLNRPRTIVISQRLAKDYFPDENPLGKTIQYSNELDFEITGVFEDVPANSTFQFEYLASFTSLPEIQKLWGGNREDELTQMDAWNYETYLMTSYPRIGDLQQRVDEKVYARLNDGKPVPENHVQDWLQPIREIHFTHGIKGDYGGTGDMQYIYIFSAVAVFVLVIAAFNFINLTTARGVKRAKEVAMRKSMGASRQQVIRQFLGETSLLVVIAFVIAFQMLELGIPLFNSFMDMKLSFSITRNYELMLFILGLGVVTAIAAGGYPALYLSSFEPVRVLKLDKISSGKSSLRKAIIVIQFGIASFMIIGTALVYLQMRFMEKVPLGFEKENVVCFIPTVDIRLDFDQFKERLLQIDGVMGVTISNGVPGQIYGHWLYKIPEFGDKPVAINTAAIDYDYLDVLGIELTEGRDLSPEHSTDAALGYLVNETAVKKFLLDHPVGTEMQVLDNAHEPGTIVGVVKDFHWRSLHHPVEPLVLRIDPNNSWQISVRLDAEKTSGALELIKKEWDRKSSESPFDFTFLDQNLDRLYKSEEKTGALMTSFSSLAIVIACLGLFGLSAFMIEQRKKEVGIRKAMGAGVYNIISLLSWDFLRMVVIGFLMIIPLAWYAADQWLQNFTYRIPVSPMVFLGSGFLVVLLAFVTVGTLSYRASAANPGEILKYE